MYKLYDCFKVAHNNRGFDQKVLLNNMRKFNVAWPNGQYINFFDSLDLMKKVKDVSNGNLTKISLNACLDYFFQEEQASPHTAFWGKCVNYILKIDLPIFILGSTQVKIRQSSI